MAQRSPTTGPALAPLAADHIGRAAGDQAGSSAVAARPDGHETPARRARAERPDGRFHAVALDHLYDGVYFVDRERRIISWNAGAERITGFPAQAVVGLRCPDDLLNHVDEAGRSLCTSTCPLKATLDDGASREVGVYLRHHDGYRVPVLIRTAAVRDATGAIVGAVEVFDDAREVVGSRQEVEHLRDLALRDPLTGLPERRHLEMALASRLSDLVRNRWPFGILFGEVDRFARLEERYGAGGGDDAVMIVARTLAASTRPGDLLGRWGVERFAILVTTGDRAILQAVARRLSSLVRRSQVVHEGRHIRVTLSMGGVLARPDDSPATLLARAESALERARAAGRDRVVVLDDLRA